MKDYEKPIMNFRDFINETVLTGSIGGPTETAEEAISNSLRVSGVDSDNGAFRYQIIF